MHIYKRRWCAEDESVADLIEQASQQALANAGVTAEELDLIIVATDTPEYISPSTASVTQHRLGAKKAGTFDLNTACAGFVTALDVAAKYIQADNRYGNVLVVGGYAMSKHLNLKDKKTVTLFADGAGAIILQAQKDTDRGFLTSRLHTEGQYHDWMGIYGGGTFKPISDQVLAEHDHQLKFVHRFPKELNPKIWSEMALEMAEEIQVNPQDVSQYLVTQLNINGIWETMDKLQVPRERAHTVMQNFGYTGSACIPMALHDAVQKGKIKEGDLLFLIGSGGGLAFASAAVRF
ncbi:MAG: ketoacyl-ACP synthase III [Bacteroidota bacterium]